MKSNKLVRDGMSEKDFEATRQFLSKYVNVLDQRPGCATRLRARQPLLRHPELHRLRARRNWQSSHLTDVNRAIKKYLQADNVKIVVVTKDAQAFKEAAVANKPSPISYTSPPPKEILEEDKLIESYKLNFNPKHVEVVPVDQVFQK